MAELDSILKKYTDPDTGSIHGAAFVAVDSKGDYIYRKAFGSQKVDVNNSPPLTLDTPTWIASQTKLTSSVAAMQVVEQGLIGLDDDVRQILPQLQDLKVITGFKDEETSSERIASPILEDLKGPITMRQLVTHTSGFCYDKWHPLLVQYSAWAGRKAHMFSGTIEGYLHPLVFQPGTSWAYGPGLDWAGQVVAKLTGMDFDAYQQKYIWEKLGATNTTFFPAKRGICPDQVHETAERAPGEGPQGLKSGTRPWLFDCRDALGGGGLFSTANDYGKLLAALVAGGGSLLSKASVDEMFSWQLGPGSMEGLRQFLISTGPEKSKSWLWAQSPGQWKDVMEVQHCLCGVSNSADVDGRRRKNTASWDGLPNLLWFIDRESGVAATFFTQIMPMDDPYARQVCTELEEALYRTIDGR